MTPTEVEAQIQLSYNEAAKGNYSEAERVANDVLAKLDKNPPYIPTPEHTYNAEDASTFNPLEEERLSLLTLRSNALLALAWTNFKRGNYDLSLEQSHHGLTLAVEGNLINCKTKAWYILGSVNIQLGNYSKALEYFNHALAVYIELGEIDGVARVTGSIGLVYQNLGNYSKALEYFNNALASFTELGDSASAARTMVSIGSICRNLGNYDKALEYFNNSLAIQTELGDISGVAKVTGNIGNVYRYLGNYDKALEFYNNALASHYELGEIASVALVMGNMGSVYAILGNYDNALEYFNLALASHTKLGEIRGVAGNTGSIGSVYQTLGNYDKALEYLNNALDMHTELGAIASIALVTGNIAGVYLKLGNYEKALEYYNKALETHKDLREIAEVASIMGSIGNVYKNLGNYDKALEYYDNAIATLTEIGEIAEIASITGNIGILYADKKYNRYDTAKAEAFMLQAIDSGTQIGAKPMVIAFHKSLADLYKTEKRWEEFATHLEKYIEIKDEVNIEETKKQDAIREQQKAIELAKAKADAKHQATEQLLHNVLPPSIADKMLDGAKLIAEKIPSVSVLFADIVNFTKLSQSITPEELVDGLDRIFSTFDALAEKYELEKIKTIGDAYMVVSGAPIQREDHAELMAQFALEMVEAMKEFRSISTGEEIQLRIGIHSGEVVAGVIGKKKFAYDLWGDAVNTASRMESHGEAGKIHVSEEFKHAVETQNFASLQFIERGEMGIKGKGMMKTYFLEQSN